MAKLNRVETLRALFEKGGWDVLCRPIPEWIDSDVAIDGFGKLAKGGVTQDMLDYLIDTNSLDMFGFNGNGWGDEDVNDPTSMDWMRFFNAKYVKKLAKDNGFASETPAKPKKEVVPMVEKVEVAPIKIDGAELLGAMGKAMAESVAGEYAPKVVEAALPIMEAKIAEKYDVKRKKVIVEVPDRGEVEGVFHEKFEKVLKYVIKGTPVMLVGDAGTGKNVMTEQIAEAMGLKFYFANKVSDEYQLKGFVDAKGKFQSTPLYDAMKNGGVFMLDEMDASNEEALEVLHSVLSNKYLTFPNGEFVKSHEDFRVVAGCNTFGTGATYQYVGRHQLDAATLNRFMTVVVDYSPTIEESLTDDKDLLSFIRKFRKCCKEFGINHVVSYRNITQLDMYVEDVGVDEVLRDGLLKNLEKDDLTMLVGRFDGDDDRWAKALKNCVA